MSQMHMKLRIEDFPITDDISRQQVSQPQVPFDPNLIHPVCEKNLPHIGEIQLFHSHVKECRTDDQPQSPEEHECVRTKA